MTDDTEKISIPATLIEVQHDYTISTQVTGFQHQRHAETIRKSLYNIDALIEMYGVERIGFRTYSSGETGGLNDPDMMTAFLTTATKIEKKQKAKRQTKLKP